MAYADLTGTTNFKTIVGTTASLTTAANAQNFKLRGTAMDSVWGSSTVVGSKTIAHGLTTVSSVHITPRRSTATLANRAAVFDVTNTGGTLTVRAWKATSAATSTLIAATATSSIYWAAFGTK